MAESRLMQVLLVDHDGVSRYTLSKALERVGYIVAEASFAEQALDMLSRQHYDLILTEIHLPEIDGIELLRRVKARATDAVVILITGDPSVETAVQAFRGGAQDYLVKPCSSDDIRIAVDRGIARARMLMRRRRMIDAIERNVFELAREAAESAATSDGKDHEPMPQRARDQVTSAANALVVGPLSLVPGRFQVTAGAQSISLTPTEFDLLAYLAAHRNRVVSCQELVSEVRGYGADETEAREVMRPHVSNLRRKLRQLGQYGKLVVNVRGIGYRLGELDAENQD